MKPLVFIFLLPLFLLSYSFHVSAAQDFILETCNKCSQNDPNIYNSFCVRSLQAAPESHCADLRKLGKISIKLVRHNVTNTRIHIKKLLMNKKIDPFVRSCLKDCLDLYSDAVPDIKKALQDYRSKHYDDANVVMSSVLDASVTCEDSFKERQGIVSPLTNRNSNILQLSAISLSIINMLH